MKSILYVSLPVHEGDPIQVAREQGDRLEILTHRGPFGTANCVAFAPATAVAHFRASVPARSETEALRAALYAIEDELAQPVEEVHLSLGPKVRACVERDIYVVDKSVMAGWLALLAKAGMSPETIIPEQSLFTDIEQAVDLGDRVIQRDGTRIVGIETTLPAGVLDALSVSSESESVKNGLQLIRLAERSATRKGVNLRTGQFALEKSQKQGAGAWRKAAGIAVAAVSVWTGTLILEAHNYNFAIRQMNQHAAERYAGLFPGAAVPGDMERATRNMLAVTGTPDRLEFRTATAALYEAVALNPGVSISALTFSSPDNRLSARLNITSFESEGSIVAFLQSRGFQVNTAQLGENASALSTELTLEPIP